MYFSYQTIDHRHYLRKWMGELWHATTANWSVPGNPEGAGQIKSMAPGWVCQHYFQTNSGKLITREVNNSRDEGMEKRRGEIYFRFWQPGEVTGSSPNNPSLSWENGHLESFKKRFRGLYFKGKHGVCDHGWGWYVFSPWSGKARDLWGVNL